MIARGVLRIIAGPLQSLTPHESSFPAMRPTYFLASGIFAILLASAGCDSSSTDPPPSPNGVIAGTVIGGRGGPMAGVSVTTIPETRSVVTDANGRFVIDGIAGGSYTVVAARDTARARATCSATSDTGRVSIRLSVWRLVWSDEFDGGAVDPTRWRQPEGDAGFPEELNRLRAAAASVAGGRLRITSGPDVIEPGRFTGSMLVSQPMFMHGRFEVRGKLPVGRGLWPAYWLWPLDKHSAPEIDIMEMLGHDPMLTYATYHYGDASGARQQVSRSWRGFDRSKEFFTYAVEWYPGECRWLIDGVEVFRTPMIQPDEPMNLIVCTIVGGWAGTPDGSTVWPQYHDVEFARVYEAVE